MFLGGGTKYTRQRVVDFCEGWLPIGFDADAVLRGLEDLGRRAEEAGRDRATINVSVFGVQGEAEVLERYDEAGVDRSILGLPSASRDEVLPILDKYAALL